MSTRASAVAPLSLLAATILAGVVFASPVVSALMTTRSATAALVVAAPDGESPNDDPASGEPSTVTIIVTGACCYDGGCFVTLQGECDVIGGVYQGDFTTCADLNQNGMADVCEGSGDCNTNMTPDDKDIAGGASMDTNQNGIPDECERDCNTNGIDDLHEIMLGESEDFDMDGIPDECCEVGKIYTSMADFNEGHLFNVEHVNDSGDDCIRLIGEVRAWPYVAVANSGRDTLVRIDINTGDVLGEYRTHPNGMAGNPSRTTGDAFGNIWVTNRDEAGFIGAVPKGSVTRIGLVIGGTRGDKIGSTFVPNPNGDYLQPPFIYNTCSDRDGDGLIKTSRGYPQVTGTSDYINTVLPWPNTASADSFGGVSTAEDECITAYVRVAGTGTRFLAIDPAGDIWTGGLYNSEFEKIDDATATVIPATQFNSSCGGYGGLIDKTNVMWSATGLLRRALPAGPNQCALGHYAYGVAIDPLTNNIWTSVGNSVNEVSPAGALLNTYLHGGGGAQGLTVDSNSTVWVAHSASPSVNTVGRLLTTGTFVGNVDLDTNPSSTLGRGPTGVAVDSNDKVWSTNYFSDNAMRIDRTLGVAGAVDLVVDLGAFATPYNYSDMTGSVLLQAVAPQGNWTTIYDSGVVGNIWNLISWSANLGPGASVMVQVRASNSPLPSGPWTLVGNAIPFSGVTGRYLQIQVILKRPPKSNALAELCDLKICSKPPVCLIISNERVQCGELANQYYYKFDLTNNGTFPITHLFLTPDMPVTVNPNHIILGTPLLPTQTTTITLPYPPGLVFSNVTPGQPFCIYMTAHDKNLEGCCTIKHMVQFDLQCGPGVCCRPCAIGGGCVAVPNKGACDAVAGTFYPGINCTLFLCPPCIIIWHPVDVGGPIGVLGVGGVGVEITPDGLLKIDTIRPTGADGFNAYFEESEELELGWLDPESSGALEGDAHLRTRLFGTFDGVADRLLGDFRATKKANGIELKADFYMVGGLGLLQIVQVFNGGALVSETVLPAGVIATASAWPTGMAAGRADAAAGAPYYSFRWSGPVAIGFGGLPPQQGDEMRILAGNPAGVVEAVSSVAVSLNKIPLFIAESGSSNSMSMGCPGDCNGDHVLDADDIQNFVDCLLIGGGTPGAQCGCADLNGDGSADPSDLALLVTALVSGQACP